MASAGRIVALNSMASGTAVGLHSDRLISADGSSSPISESAGNGVSVQETGVVFMAGGAEVEREAALAAGAQVVDVGALSLNELRSVVKSYNESPWTSKSGLDAAVQNAASMADEVAAAPKAASKGAASKAAKPLAGAALAEAKKAELTAKVALEARVYSDDMCFGKPAPSMAGLDFVHGERVEVGAGKITAVVFWAKFAKGDTETVSTFSSFARSNPDVNFVGVSCDPERVGVEKFIAKIGQFQPELGAHGLTIEADFALAFDPERAYMLAMKKTSGLMSLGVGMCYLMDASGTIVWREMFSRGASLTGQFTEQLALLKAGKPLIDNGPNPDDGGEEEEVVSKMPVVKAPGECDY